MTLKMPGSGAPAAAGFRGTPVGLAGVKPPATNTDATTMTPRATYLTPVGAAHSSTNGASP